MLYFKNASVERGGVVRWELQPSSLGEITFQGVGLKLADGVNPEIAARITSFPERFYLDTNYDPPKLMERLDDESEVEVDVDPPAVPTGVTVSPIVRGISVTMDPPAEDVQFEIHVSATQGFTPGAETVKALGNTSPFVVGNLAPGTYYVRVRAKDGAGNWSDYSSEVSGQAGKLSGDDVDEHSIDYAKLNVAYAVVTSATLSGGGSATVVKQATDLDDCNVIKLSDIFSGGFDVVPLTIWHNSLSILHGIPIYVVASSLASITYIPLSDWWITFTDMLQFTIGELNFSVQLATMDGQRVEYRIKKWGGTTNPDVYFGFIRHSVV